MSGDVLVKITSHPRGLLVKATSQLGEKREERIQDIAREFVTDHSIGGIVEIEDNAASEWVIYARLRTAARRWANSLQAVPERGREKA